MLVSFSASNFKSILGPVTLNMIADTNDKTADWNLINLGEQNLNPISMIYGANGSGKSSLLDAFNFVRMFVLGRPWESFPRNRMAPAELDSEFKVAYIDSGSPKEYTLKVTSEGRVHEHFEWFNGKEWLVDHDDWVPVDPNHGAEVFVNVDPHWDGFEYRTGQMSFMPDFFRNTIVFNSIDDDIELSVFEDPYVMKSILSTPRARRGLLFLESEHISLESFKAQFLNFLHSLGVNVLDLAFESISSVSICEEYPEVDKLSFDSELPSLNDIDEKISQLEDDMEDFDPSDYDVVESKQYKLYQLCSLKYDGFSVPVEEESAGTQRILKMVNMFINRMVFQDALILIDEVDAGLHDTLATEIIRQFLETKASDSTSQLIVTTHNTMLMRSPILRKDQIWFSEMKQDRSSDIFSLADLQDVKPTEDFAENYLCGRYGALPKVPEWEKEADYE